MSSEQPDDGDEDSTTSMDDTHVSEHADSEPLRVALGELSELEERLRELQMQCLARGTRDVRERAREVVAAATVHIMETLKPDGEN